jgi:hypothetical protein
MIQRDTVWNGIWPVVQKLVMATLEENENGLEKLLVPRSRAAELYDLFGLYVFDILLKTILGREQLGLARAIETENGRFVYLEFAWPDPSAGGNTYAETDVVSVQVRKYRNSWRVSDVNPASTNSPMSEPRANTILLANQALEGDEDTPLEPWLLPVALFGGAVQLPIQEKAMRDTVDALVLPVLQALD